METIMFNPSVLVLSSAVEGRKNTPEHSPLARLLNHFRPEDRVFPRKPAARQSSRIKRKIAA